MGSFTLNTTSAHDARILSAFGKYLNTQDLTDPQNPVPRDATGAEVKQFLINQLKQVVFDQEAREARQAAQDAITQIDPT